MEFLVCFFSLHIIAFFLIYIRVGKMLQSVVHPVNLYFSFSYFHFFLGFLKEITTIIPIVSLLISSITVIITFVVMNYVVRSSKKKEELGCKEESTDSNDKAFIMYSAFLLTLGLISFSILLYQQGISIIEYFAGMAYYYMALRQGSAWVFIAITFSALAPLIYLSCAKKLKSKIVIPFVIITMLLLICTGGRSPLIVFLYQITAILCTRNDFSHFKNDSAKLIKYVILFVSVILIAIGGFIYTTVSRLDVDLSGYIQDVVIVDFDKGRTIDDFLLKYPDAIFFGEYHGATLSDLAQYFVPRAWKPDKEISTYATRDLDPLAAESGSNMTFGFIPLALFNFGIVGVIVESILFTIVYSWAYDKIGASLPRGECWKKAALAVLLSYQYIFMNGGILTHFWFILSLQISLIYLTNKVALYSSKMKL